MKNATLRILSAMLIVCMLLSALPFAAFAAEKPAYSWTAAEYFAATKALVEGSEDLVQIQIPYGNSNTGFTTKYADPANASYAGAGNEYLVYTINNNASTAGQSFVNTKFNTVGAGTYTVTFDVKNWGATTTLNVHVFSEEDFAGITNSSGRASKTAELISAGNHLVHTLNTTSKTDTDLTFTADLPEAPIICLAGPATGGVKNAIQFTNVSFVKGGSSSAPQPTTPAPTTPAATEPATEPATTPSTEPSTTPSTEPSTTPSTEPSTAPSTAPADNAGADEGSFPVAAIVAIVVVVLGGAAAGIYFFLKKKKAA